MSFTNMLLDLALEAYNNVEVAKKLALVSVTFFAYDMLLTLETEIKYVWSAQWGYGRAAFHFNHVWSILILAVYLPMIFGYDVPIPVIMFYGYGIILLVFNTSVVMSMRAWVLYDRNPFIATGLALACIGGAVSCIVILNLDVGRAIFIPNFMPELITGCLTILPRRITLAPYIIALLLDTIIFLATWYRAWTLNRNGVRIPLIHCLMRDGLIYYVFNCASLIVAIGLGLNSKVNNIAVGSGYMIALHSILCSRILLSLRVFNSESNNIAVASGLEKTASSGKTGSSNSDDTHSRGDRSYQNVRKNTIDRDCEMQSLPVELREFSRIQHF